MGYTNILYRPDGSMAYACKGTDIPINMPDGHRWQASKQVYRNLAKALTARLREQEDASGFGPEMVCDGYTDTLSWSIRDETHAFSAVIGIGPPSVLKIMERIKRLAKDEAKNFPYALPHEEFIQPLLRHSY
ncbi:hypothetical protein [Paenibacillus glycinis]|nr:hypothetical protein [Paenibacillus glycinis]